MGSTFVLSCIMVSIITYFALFVESKFGKEHYNAFWVGIVFSATAMGAIMGSSIYSSVAASFGRKNTVIFACVVMLCMNTCCGCLGYMPNDQPQLFLVITFFFRLVLGYADG